MLESAEGEAATRITATEAEVAAANKRTGAISRQTALVRLSDKPPVSIDKDRLVWVVNVDPSSVAGVGPHGGVLTDPKLYAGMMVRVEYLLIFFDAATGEFIYGIEKAGELIPIPEDTGPPFVGTPQPTP